MKDLIEWTEHFIKSRDIIRKSIECIAKKEDRLEVKYKDKQHTYIMQPELKADAITSEYKDAGYLTVITLNTDKNIATLIENWKELAKHEKLSICFINPSSKTDTKWIICPCTHNRIADKDSLKLGIQAMADAVEKIT